MSDPKPLQIAFAVITRSGNLSPLHIERLTVFRDAEIAHRYKLPDDRVSRVWIFEEDPRLLVDSLRNEISGLRRDLKLAECDPVKPEPGVSDR